MLGVTVQVYLGQDLYLLGLLGRAGRVGTYLRLWVLLLTSPKYLPTYSAHLRLHLAACCARVNGRLILWN